MMHFTDDKGYKSINSQVDWTFRASDPPGDRQRGAYFTTLRPAANRFSARTRIPRHKQAYVFEFDGHDGLKPVTGQKGKFIFFSPIDYTVMKVRHRYCGRTEGLP